MRNARLRLAALTGVAAIGFMAAPVAAASAATSQQAASISARQEVAAFGVHGAAIHPDFSNGEVNCSNGTFGTSGGQWYFQIACSLINATSWTAIVECSNGGYYGDGPFTTFENVQVYCPIGTTPVEGYVGWTT